MHFFNSLFLHRQFDPVVNLFDTKFSCFTFLPTWHHRLATFRLQYEDDYEYASLPYWVRALGLQGENFWSARAQNFKLLLVVVLVLQFEGRYSEKQNLSFLRKIKYAEAY